MLLKIAAALGKGKKGKKKFEQAEFKEKHCIVPGYKQSSKRNTDVAPLLAHSPSGLYPAVFKSSQEIRSSKVIQLSHIRALSTNI
ncbi:MAG: hypothetical protein GY699_00015 [Desulfobacteraceae bacterium]|nr:hypothetical protein [Desulfobacteraceae bacterium]